MGVVGARGAKSVEQPANLVRWKATQKKVPAPSAPPNPPTHVHPVPDLSSETSGRPAAPQNDFAAQDQVAIDVNRGGGEIQSPVEFVGELERHRTIQHH